MPEINSSQIDQVLKVGDRTGIFPYGFNSYGFKRVYIIENKWKIRQWFLSLISTASLSLFLFLKYSFMVIFDGFVLLESLTVLLPVIIYCTATVIQLNILWKLREHKDLMNQFYLYMHQLKKITFNRHRQNEREDKYIGKKIILVFIVFASVVFAQLFSCLFFSDLNNSLVSFALHMDSVWWPVRIVMTLILIGILAQACFTVVVYFCVIVNFASAVPYVLAELKVMSKDPFLHPRVFRRKYRALQILIVIMSEAIEALLPLVVVFLVILSVISNFVAIRNRSLGDWSSRESGKVSGNFLVKANLEIKNFKAQLLPLYSIAFVAIVRVSIGKAAEFVGVSAEVLNTWTKSATSCYMLKFLYSCQTIRIRVVGFGFIDNSTFLTLMGVILNYTISTAITL